ncbi:MAG: hypothetical protein JWO69_2039 [Thermoleophilia bacterium]|nr:hypothetical protein [Thermoleophilia bacterium]
MSERAFNAPSGEYFPTHPCPSCGTPVFTCSRGVFDATGTTTGPFTRLGLARHANDIARSVYHDRLDGHARHDCQTIGATK